ncbi:cation diffusion facilitator family transporter [Cytophagaceae bacterium YF14B1]|uniref:Cation diffusion facilitator family transporter n=1 Tax=Xanthocytophaga flava TaxID=3048013 RepID=A0AAE3U987_9BACT|nr:cation diffusion facilitator family transporter [Xanthocytophaga flavus]MDJ1481998.1 cation diffusion facilitator family transporter [Xanthocytophaga flavus]
MAHTHSHNGHSHSHDHGHMHGPITNINTAFVVGIVLNLAFVVIEAGVGLYSKSLALLTDAGHNLSDVASLALALLAFRLAKVKPTHTFTYGYRKTTILVALLNAVILLIAIGGIGYEAAMRLNHTQPIEGREVAIVAGVGILINSLTAFLFFRSQHTDLNIKGAYLHMAADALVSLGVVFAGLLISATGWYWVDSITSFIVIIVILIGTWGLLRDSIILSLDGVPKDINLDEVESKALQIKGIHKIHHIHIWAISTTENALTAHLVLDSNTDFEAADQIKKKLRHELEHMNIQHATFETELVTQECTSKQC